MRRKIVIFCFYRRDASKENMELYMICLNSHKVQGDLFSRVRIPHYRQVPRVKQN